MVVIRCLRSYKKLKIDAFPIFAQGVKNNIYLNSTVFTTPPLTDTVFQGLIDAYIDKRSAYVNGGKDQEPAWNNARTQLMDAVNSTADYVDTLVNGNENIVMLAGYQPTKSNASNVTKPTKITGVELSRTEVAGTLVADCDAQKGVNAYVCILTKGAPLPAGITVNGKGQITIEMPDSPEEALAMLNGLESIQIDLNQNRKKEFENLELMKTYYCVYIGINAGGVGGMSDADSIVCVAK